MADNTTKDMFTSQIIVPFSDPDKDEVDSLSIKIELDDVKNSGKTTFRSNEKAYLRVFTTPITVKPSEMFSTYGNVTFSGATTAFTITDEEHTVSNGKSVALNYPVSETNFSFSWVGNHQGGGSISLDKTGNINFSSETTGIFKVSYTSKFYQALLSNVKIPAEVAKNSESLSVLVSAECVSGSKSANASTSVTFSDTTEEEVLPTKNISIKIELDDVMNKGKTSFRSGDTAHLRVFVMPTYEKIDRIISSYGDVAIKNTLRAIDIVDESHSVSNAYNFQLNYPIYNTSLSAKWDGKYEGGGKITLSEDGTINFEKNTIGIIKISYKAQYYPAQLYNISVPVDLTRAGSGLNVAVTAIIED